VEGDDVMPKWQYRVVGKLGLFITYPWLFWVPTKFSLLSTLQTRLREMRFNR
jgi:hypothetical protein